MAWAIVRKAGYVLNPYRWNTHMFGYDAGQKMVTVQTRAGGTVNYRIWLDGASPDAHVCGRKEPGYASRRAWNWLTRLLGAVKYAISPKPHHRLHSLGQHAGV